MENHCEHHHHHSVEKQNEKKALIVIIFTLITMLAEIAYGYLTNSMALLADGWHMGTHALALGIAYGAYICIRKIHEKNGSDIVSEKISALAGYTSSLFLTLTAVWIIIESFGRLISPLSISFNEAIWVAIIGLAVNLICVVIMEYKSEKGHTDYNYKAAYLHILTDAMTSVFAIGALLAGKFFGFYFLDPIMGFVGGILILRWGIILIKNTVKVLLDLKLLKEN